MSSSVTSCFKCQINFGCEITLEFHQLMFHFESDDKLESHVYLDPPLTETLHQDVGEQIPSSDPNPCKESQNEIDDSDWTIFNEVPSTEADCELDSYMDFDPQLTINQDVQEDVGEQILTTEPYLCKELRNEIDDFDWTTFNKVPSTEADCEIDSYMDLDLPLIEHQYVQDDVSEQILTTEPYLCEELQNEIDDFDWTTFNEVPSTKTDCELDSYMDFDLPLIEHQYVQEDVGEQVLSSEPRPCEESQNEIDDFDWTTFNEVPSIEADGELESYMGLDPQLTIHQDVQEDVGEQILTTEPYLCEELQNEIDDFDWTIFNEVPSTETDCELDSYMDFDLPLIEHQDVQEDLGEQILTTEPYPCEESQNEIDDFDWTTFNKVPSTELDCELYSYMDFDLPLIEHQGVQEDVGEQILTTEPYLCEELQNEIDNFDWTIFNEVPSTEADCELDSYIDFDLPLIEHQDVQEGIGEQVLGSTPNLCKESQTESDDFHQTLFINVPRTEVCCDREQSKHQKTAQKRFYGGRKDYECDVCQKTFSSKSYTKMHIKAVHEGQKNFECDVCQKIFSSKSYTKMHIKAVHEGEKNFKCDVCQKNFSQTIVLKKHIKTVHDEQKDYECNVCHKAFTRQDILKRHIKIVHDKQKDYKCDECHKVFSEKGNLKQHKNAVHEGQKNFECDLCQKTFLQQSNLKRHIKTVHDK